MGIHVLILALVVIVGMCRATFAQSAPVNKNGQVNTNTRIIYHNGPVMAGAQDVYLIWYGCWDNSCGTAGDTNTQSILSDFIQSIGGSPYFKINGMYPNMFGQTPTGALFYGGAVFDHNSQGMELTQPDIAAIVEQQIASLNLPQDPVGIYIVITSADVSSSVKGLCVPAALAHHGTGCGARSAV